MVAAVLEVVGQHALEEVGLGLREGGLPLLSPGELEAELEAARGGGGMEQGLHGGTFAAPGHEQGVGRGACGGGSGGGEVDIGRYPRGGGGGCLLGLGRSAEGKGGQGATEELFHIRERWERYI